MVVSVMKWRGTLSGEAGETQSCSTAGTKHEPGLDSERLGV